MNYEEAKAYKQQLEDKTTFDGNKLKAFDVYRNEMGIVPDHIRETSEYRMLKKECEKSFAALREFNGWFVKKFKKEYAADRKKRYVTK